MTTIQITLAVAILLTLIGAGIYFAIRQYLEPLKAGHELLSSLSGNKRNGASAGRWAKFAAFCLSTWVRLRRWLHNAVFLQPYGQTMLDGKSRAYLTLYGVFALITALLEGLCWAAIAFIFTPGGWRWLAAMGLFLVIFCLIWGLDVALALNDSNSEKIAKELKVAYLKSGAPGLKFAAPFRILLLSGSFFVAAPLLALIIFSADCRTVLREQGANAIASMRTEIQQKQAAILKARDEEIGTLHHRLDLELAGHGETIIKGRGIEARNLEQQIGVATEARKADVLAGKSELDAFEYDAARWETDPHTLANRWHCIVPNMDSILQNFAALKSLQQRPDYHYVELSIRFIFALAAACALGGKLCEPTGVALYNSSLLHGLYSDFSPPKPLSAERFFAWIKQQGMVRLLAARQKLMSQEPAMIEDVKQREIKAQERSQALEKAQVALERRQLDCNLQRRKSERCAEEIRAIDAQVMSPLARQLAWDQSRGAQEEADTGLALLEHELLALKRSVQQATEQFTEIAVELQTYTSRLADLRGKIHAIEHDINHEEHWLEAA